MAFRDSFSDPAQLLSAAAVLLDLQHYHPQLLQEAAAAALSAESEDTLTPDAVVSMLLALGFFRVEVPDFVETVIGVRTMHCMFDVSCLHAYGLHIYQIQNSHVHI